ncbi:Bug family tripartite tricarboxylate transporter substrate binding protein [Roseomonas sp. CCTCC AB2023176]|uniref:Bug family tripartite tricarboxylate transporter substrate binding protein n=1 Tax=Roseomonas sp. CCTCC AB2023176 TaxID=3342640 RepID=UPI0035D746EA
MDSSIMSDARVGRRTAIALPLLAAPAIGRAQGAWPTRPVRIVVAFGTGGGTDVTTRLIAPRLSQILGQPVVIENRAGGGGTIGADYVAKLPPDGTTFVLATLSSIGIAPALYPRLPYDPARDLVAVAPTVYVPICMTVTTAGLDARDVPGFVGALKGRPMFYGSAGVGTTGHLASAGFLTRTGATAEHVPFRNPAETYTALVAGRVQFTSDIPSLMLPFVRDGKARILFVATPERMPSIPDVPTAEEVGLSGYRAYSWYGLFGPAGTQPEVVSRLAAAVDEALADPTIQARFEEFGTPAMRGWEPARFSRYVREEIEAWGPLVRASGARVE